MKDVAADASEIARTVVTLAKADTAKTHKTVDTAETADIASAHGPWLPLPVTDVSDVLDISVAAPQLAPRFNLSDECDSPVCPFIPAPI